MSTKIKINITKEVLEKSMYSNHPFVPLKTHNGTGQISENCAIAVAIWDIIPNIRVSHTHVVFQGKKCISPLPEEARLFICNFDKLHKTPEKRLELTPFSFEIDIPDEVIDSISIEEIVRLKKCDTFL